MVVWSLCLVRLVTVPCPILHCALSDSSLRDWFDKGDATGNRVATVLMYLSGMDSWCEPPVWLGMVGRLLWGEPHPNFDIYM